MGVHLGCCDVCVTEHLLESAQVASACQQMGSKGVAKRMWRKLSWQTRTSAVASDGRVQGLARQLAASSIEEEPSVRLISQ